MSQFSFFGDPPAPDQAPPPPDASTDGQAPAASRRGRRPGLPPPVHDDAMHALGNALPDGLHLGTSSWSFPGWHGLVYGAEASETRLSRDGLTAYGQHPLLATVSLDRTFYAPIGEAQYAHYASQVPAGFRFVVKAPSLVTDAVLRGDRGTPTGPNPSFLDAAVATDHFVRPCLAGLGDKAGPLVFQFSPLPGAILADPAAWVARLETFLAALPPLSARDGATQPFYAVEFRDPQIVTPRMMHMLADRGVRYCVAIHARMPSAERQLRAVAATGPGPLVVRWSLLAGQRYQAAKARFAPFDKLVVEDPATRAALAAAAAAQAAAGQPAWIIVNNKAEGCAPLSIQALARAIAAPG